MRKNLAIALIVALTGLFCANCAGGGSIGVSYAAVPVGYAGGDVYTGDSGYTDMSAIDEDDADATALPVQYYAPGYAAMQRRCYRGRFGKVRCYYMRGAYGGAASTMRPYCPALGPRPPQGVKVMTVGKPCPRWWYPTSPNSRMPPGTRPI